MRADGHLAEKTMGQAQHHCTERAVASVNMDIRTFAEWVRFGGLNPDPHAGRLRQAIHTTSWVVICSAIDKLCKLGTVNSKARRKPR